MTQDDPLVTQDDSGQPWVIQDYHLGTKDDPLVTQDDSLVTLDDPLVTQDNHLVTQENSLVTGLLFDGLTC